VRCAELDLTEADDAKTNVCFVLRAIIRSWTCVNCAHRVAVASTLTTGGRKQVQKIKKAIIGSPSEGFAGRKYHAS
jgi:hypothetical protein